MTDTLRSAVYAIPPEDWDTWFRVGSALKTQLGEAGFDLWDTWSSTSQKYKAQEVRKTWTTLQKGRVTVGTIYWLAMQHGWAQPEGQARTDPPIVDRQEIQRELRQRKVLAKQAAAEAQRIIGKCTMGPHPYMAHKGFPDLEVMVYTGPIGGTWVYDRMVLPVRDRWHKLLNVQHIDDEGNKRFLYGGVMRGGRLDIGRGKDLFLVDGYATGMSVMRCLQQFSVDATVRVAFMASNMPLMVTKTALVIADHDKTPDHMDYGAGEMYARKTGCRWWQPDDEGCDFNDLEMILGTYAASELLREFVYRRAQNE